MPPFGLEPTTPTHVAQTSKQLAKRSGGPAFLQTQNGTAARSGGSLKKYFAPCPLQTKENIAFVGKAFKTRPFFLKFPDPPVRLKITF